MYGAGADPIWSEPESAPGPPEPPKKVAAPQLFFTPCFAFFKGVMLTMNIRPNELTKTKFAHRRRSQKGPKFAN